MTSGYRTDSSVTSVTTLYFIFLEQEDNLAATVYGFARRGFPFKPNKLCQLAYEMAIKSKKAGFSPTKKTAGRAWLTGFLQRYPILRKKNTKNLNIARAKGGNKVKIGQFFDLYTPLLEKWGLNFHPNNVWNVDECGVPDIPDDGTQVIGITGERAHQVVGGEKGTNTTIVSYISAGGLATPPLIIFKGTRVQGDWRELAPTGYMLKVSELGYINQEIFAAYGEQFVKYLKEKNLVGPDRKAMVIFDLHKSHLFNLKYMEMMLENNVEVVSFPPHCTHILQPLDDAPFALFKSKWKEALLQVNLAKAGQKINKYDFFKVFVPAFTQAMTPEAIRKGWANTGVFPPNPNAPKILQNIDTSEPYDKCK